jgi:hypothetical protein
MEQDIMLNPMERPQEWDKLTGRRDSVDVKCIRGINGDVARKSKRFHRACEAIIEAVVEKRYHRTRFENRNSNIQVGRRK